MSRHQDATGAGAVHQFAYKQSSDPGAVGPKKGWIDTSSGPPYELKVRTDANDAWETVGSTGGSAGYDTVAEGGTDRTQRSKLNFGNGLDAVDNAGATRTDVTVDESELTHNSLGGLTTGDPHTQYQLESEKNQANGYAGLNGSSKLTASQIPDTAVSAGSYTNASITVGADGRLTAASTGSGGSVYRTLVTLGSDVATTNTTGADVTGLSFPVTSGTIYRFYTLIIYTTSATGNGSGWGLEGPASPTLFAWNLRFPGTTATTVQWHNIGNGFGIAGGSATTSSPNTTHIAEITGVINPSSSGTVIVRFRSELSSETITAKAGSTLEYW